MLTITIISLLNSFLIVAVTNLKQIDRNFGERRYSPLVSNDVPQIWLTYREFAALLNCNPTEVRKASIAAGLDRRKSRDGETRIKLTPALETVFLEAVVQRFLEERMAACAGDLRTLEEFMRRKPKPGLRLTTPAV